MCTYIMYLTRLSFIQPMSTGKNRDNPNNHENKNETTSKNHTADGHDSSMRESGSRKLELG